MNQRSIHISVPAPTVWQRTCSDLTASGSYHFTVLLIRTKWRAEDPWLYNSRGEIQRHSASSSKVRMPESIDNFDRGQQDRKCQHSQYGHIGTNSARWQNATHLVENDEPATEASIAVPSKVALVLWINECISKYIHRRALSTEKDPIS